MKELELTEALTLREQEVEEFRFINQQLKQEIQDLKAAYKELSQQADSHKSSSEEHRLKYEQTLSEVEKARQDKDEKMAQTNTEYQLQVDSLKEQLKVVEEERNQITMEMSAELDKMQIELAEKINAMAEMERNIASY